MQAGPGHNSRAFGEDETLPPKSERVVDKELAAKILIAVTLAAKRCQLAKKLVLEKRKGGEEGRLLRNWAIWYSRGLGAPVWMSAKIWDLNRKQIGQEEEAFIAMTARNEELGELADDLTAMCDAALRFDPKAFMRIGLSERAADQAAKKVLKTVQQARERLERPNPKPTPNPRPMTEAERLVAEGQAQRRRLAREQAERMLNAVIAKDGTSKEASRDAANARKALAELNAAQP